MKFSVSTYSYGKYLSPESLGIKGVMDHAKSLGFDGIEIDAGEYIKDDCVLDTIKEYSDKIGLPIVAYDVGADFTKNDCTSLSDEIERVKCLVLKAKRLGAPLMRHDVSYGDFTSDPKPTFEDVLPVITKGCREVTEFAEKHGIKTLFENHGFFIQHPERMRKILDEVGHPNFGILLDIGNFMCSDNDAVTAVKQLKDKAVHVHAKDFYFLNKEHGECTDKGWFKTFGGNYLCGSIVGLGNAGAEQSIKTLIESGYDGYITIEFEGIEDNLYGIAEGLKNLRRIVGEYNV